MKNTLLVLALSLFFVACGLPQNQSPKTNPNPEITTGSAVEELVSGEISEVAKGEKVTTKSGLKYEVLEVGTGERAQNGDKISVHYTGWLTDGTKFDSSVDRGEPFGFILGARQVIKGWDEGVLNMQKGESRRLTIPANLGYGTRERAKIPANSTLIFDVELIEITD